MNLFNIFCKFILALFAIYVNMLHFCLLKKIFLFIFFNYWHFFAFPSILLCIFHVQSSKYNQNNTAPLRQTQESFLFPFSATQSRFKPGLGLFFAYTNRAKYDIIPSLTLENSKTAITPVFYQRCGCSLSCIDMYYFWICAIFSVLFLL